MVHSLLCQVLGTFNCNARKLVNCQLISLIGCGMQDNFGPKTSQLYVHICGSGLVGWIQVDLVAEPAKEAITFYWGVKGLNIALKALLTCRNPHTPNKGLTYAMYWNFQNSPDEMVGSFGMTDHAEVVGQLPDALLLLFC